MLLTILYIFSGLICVIVIIAVIWRFSSDRSSIPCPSWLSWLVELDNPFLKNNSAREIILHLSLRPGMKVLDFGCGPGRLTIPVAKQNGLLSITEVIADPHFQTRKNVLAVASSVGFVEKSFFGNQISYTINFEKP